MGSLMAGWSSRVLAADHHKVRLMRNRSLTKEEVEAFWRRQHGGDSVTKRSAGDNTTSGGEMTTAVSSSSSLPSSPRVATKEISRQQLERLVVTRPYDACCSEPSSPVTPGVDWDGGGSSPSTSRDWWTRSSWAFLNEPPDPDRAVTAWP